MYHMARGYDESSRLVNEPVPSSSAPNLSVDIEPPPVEIRPSVYGSLDNTVAGISTISGTEPLLSINEDNDDPKV